MSRDLTLLSADFKSKVELFLEEAQRQGLDIFVTDAFRTTAEQRHLYAKGRTTSGGIVTWVDGVTAKSKHQLGEAIDIAFNKPSLYPKDMKLWNKLGEIAKKFGMYWGYALWGVDKPHFQNNNNIPAIELLNEYIMTPEQEQLVDAIIYNNKTAYNFGNEEMKELAAKHANEWRELKK